MQRWCSSTRLYISPNTLPSQENGRPGSRAYVFKLFTNEPIEFEDYVQTKQVQTALYLRFPNEDHFVR